LAIFDDVEMSAAATRNGVTVKRRVVASLEADLNPEPAAPSGGSGLG
jgi:hypothetical protein